MIVKSYFKKGNSFPIVLEDKGKQYFVKLRAGMSGKYALVSEWFGNQLGLQLNINTQKPSWITLDKAVIVDNIHIEVKELIYKSLGLNIAFQYQEQALELKAKELQTLNKKALEEIFLFDLMMINVDRTSNNTNLMRVHDKILSIDYESSLLFQDVLGKKNGLANHGVLQCLKGSPLYQEITNDSIDDFLRKTEKIAIKEILSEIPISILTQEESNLFLEEIKHRQSNQWFLKETIDQLNQVKIETKAERKIRMNKNQALFRRNLKNNAAKNKN